MLRSPKARRRLLGLLGCFEWVLLFGYKVLIDILFIKYVYPTYSYEPLYNVFGQIQLDRLILGYILLPPVWLGARPVLRSPVFPIGRIIVAVHVLLIVIPSFTLYAQAGRPASYLAWTLLGFFLLILVIRLVPRISVPYPSLHISRWFIASGVLILAYVYTMLILKGGLDRLNFDLLQVYVYRAAYVENRFPLSGYLVPWTAYVLNMALLVYTFLRRKSVGVLLVLGLQTLLFGMTNFKAYLFLPFWVFGCLQVLPRYSFPRLALLGIISLSAVFWALAARGEILGIGLMNRMVYVPSALAGLYFDYFSTHPPAYMSGSPWIGLLGLRSPYPISSVTIIARTYWGYDFGPNVGWIAWSFANFGWTGIPMVALLLGFYARFADAIARRIHIAGASEALFMGPAIALTNSAPTTFLLTHGGLLVLLVLWVLGREVAYLGQVHSSAHAGRRRHCSELTLVRAQA